MSAELLKNKRKFKLKKNVKYPSKVMKRDKLFSIESPPLH